MKTGKIGKKHQCTVHVVQVKRGGYIIFYCTTGIIFFIQMVRKVFDESEKIPRRPSGFFKAR